MNMAIAVLAKMRHQCAGGLVAPHLPPLVRKLAGVIGWHNGSAQSLVFERSLAYHDTIATQCRDPFREHVVRMTIRFRILITRVQSCEQLIIAWEVTDDMVRQHIGCLKSWPSSHQLRIRRHFATTVVGNGLVEAAGSPPRLPRFQQRPGFDRGKITDPLFGRHSRRQTWPSFRWRDIVERFVKEISSTQKLKRNRTRPLIAGRKIDPMRRQW